MVTVKNIEPGHTLLATGTLAYNHFLYTDHGNATQPGAIIEVLHRATNEGFVDLLAGIGPGIGAAYGVVGPQGVLTNGGDLVIQSGGGYTPQGTYGAGATLMVQGVLNNASGIAVGTDLQAAGFHGGGAATLNIAAGGTLNNANYIKMYEPLPSADSTSLQGSVLNDAGTLINSAYLVLDGSGAGMLANGPVLNVAGVLENSNRLYLGEQAGATLDVSKSGYLLTTYDLYVGRTDQANVAGRLVNSGTLKVSNTYGRGTSFTDLGSVTNTGTFYLQGGSGHGFGNRYGGVLAVAGTLANDASGSSAGFVFVQGGQGAASANNLGTGATIYVSGALANHGEVYLDGGNPGTYGGTGALLSDSGIVLNDGSIYVGFYNTGTPQSGTPAMLTVTSTGQLINNGNISGYGVIDNAGVIRTAGSSTLSVQSIVNDGSIGVATNAVMTINGALVADAGGSGVLSIAAGGVLTLNGAVSKNQMVQFAAAGATLALGDVTAFSGVLSGLNTLSTIDFLNTKVIAANASHSALGIELGDGVALSLALQGATTSDLILSLASDGHGGTDLSLSADPSHIVRPVIDDPDRRSETTTNENRIGFDHPNTEASLFVSP